MQLPGGQQVLYMHGLGQKPTNGNLRLRLETEEEGKKRGVSMEKSKDGNKKS